MNKIRLTRKELAERLRLKTNTLAHWAIDGKGPKFIIVNGRVLYDLDVVEAWESDHVDELVAQLLAAGAAGAIICIDTLAQAFAGLDENSSQMGAVIEAAEALSTGIGGVAMVVHHTGKDESAGMRGWSGLPAAMDFSIECKFVKSPGAHKDDREFVLAKVKDGEDGRAFRFRLATMMLGRDEDQEQITSLVVAPQAPVTHDEVRQEMAEQHAKTDDLVWTWIRDEMTEGRHPSGNSLNGQRAAKAPHLSQGQLREAIARLLADNRLAPEGSGKKAWLRAMESSPVTPT